MFNSVARAHIYSTPHRLARCLLSQPSLAHNSRELRRSDHRAARPQITHYLVSLHTWKLTHQPREPIRHWNTRFREQNAPLDAEQDEAVDQTGENWDLWFQQNQSSTLLPFSQRNNSFLPDQVYFLDQLSSLPMPKRVHESSSSSPVEVPHKRERYSPRKRFIPHCAFTPTCSSSSS